MTSSLIFCLSSAFLLDSNKARCSRSSVYLFFFCKLFIALSLFLRTRSRRRSSSVRCGFAALRPPLPLRWAELDGDSGSDFAGMVGVGFCLADVDAGCGEGEGVNAGSGFADGDETAAGDGCFG